MPDYDEMLKAVDKNIEVAVFKKMFKGKRTRKSFLDSAHKRGHVITYYRRSRGKDFLMLTPAGRLYLREKYKSWYRKPEWWGIIVSGAIGAAGLAVALLRP